MAKRFYLSPIVGNGTEEDPYRPKAQQYQLPCVGSIASDADGRPAQTLMVVEVDANNHAPLQSDPDLIDVTAE